MKIKFLHIVTLLLAGGIFYAAKGAAVVENIGEDVVKDVGDTTASKTVSADTSATKPTLSESASAAAGFYVPEDVAQYQALTNGIAAVQKAQAAIKQLQENIDMELSLPVQDRLNPQYLNTVDSGDTAEVASSQLAFANGFRAESGSILSTLDGNISTLQDMADAISAGKSKYTAEDISNALDTVNSDLQKASTLTDQFVGKSFYTTLKNIFTQIQQYIASLIKSVQALGANVKQQASTLAERLQSLREAAPEEAASSSAVVSKAMTQEEILAKIDDATTIIEQAQDKPTPQLTQLLDLDRGINIAQARYDQFVTMNAKNPSAALAKQVAKWKAQLADLTSEQQVLINNPSYKAAVDTIATINAQQQEIDSLKQLLPAQGTAFPARATVASATPAQVTILPPPPKVAPPRPPIPDKPSAPAIPTALKPTLKAKAPAGLPDPKTSLGKAPAPPV